MRIEEIMRFKDLPFGTKFLVVDGDCVRNATVLLKIYTPYKTREFKWERILSEDLESHLANCVVLEPAGQAKIICPIGTCMLLSDETKVFKIG